MASRIPIQNIYYLLIYAWDRLAEGELVDVESIDSTELVDLYGAVLLSGLRHLVRRGLDQTYLPIECELAGIRGRVQMAPTISKTLMQHGRTQCQFDELSVDNLQNQILKSTVARILNAPALDGRLRQELGSLAHALGEISEIRLSKQAFRRIQLHRNNRFYRLLLDLCELIFDSTISTETAGRYRFRDFVRDPERMAMLFERFVFNFVKRECPGLDVKRDRIRWAAQSESDPELAYLPTMQTDISIRRPGRTLIVDAKFYQDTLQRYYGSESVRSGHLYQLLAYLKNLEVVPGDDGTAEGMLLYPAVQETLRLSYTISGHRVRVCTVDLSQEWHQIREELLDLVA